MELHVFVGNINIFSFAIIKLIKTSVVLFFWGGRGGGEAVYLHLPLKCQD